MAVLERFNNWLNKHGLRPYSILAVLVFAGYGSGLRNGYCLDDHFVTTPENEQVAKGVAGIAEIFTSAYDVSNGKGYGYRPLAEATFAIEFQMFGWNATISHLINILLIFFISVLVYKNISDLFGNWSVFWCLAVAGLFALHPLHNEVVNSLKNRDDLLVAIFGLGSLLLFLLYFKTKAVWALVAGFVAYALGFFTKNSMVPFVVFIPLTLLMFSRSSWKKGLLLFVGLAVVGKLANISGQSLLGSTPSRTMDWIENPLVAESFFTKMVNMPYYFWLYCKLHIWPWPLRSYYGFYTLELQSLSSLKPYLGLVLALAMITRVVVLYKKQRIISWGILTFLLFVAPYLNFPFLAPGLIAERFSFMSVLGFSVCLVVVLKKMSKEKMKEWSVLGLALLMGGYLIMNNLRTPAWRNLETLLATDVQKAPKSVKLNTLYAEYLHSQFRNQPTPEKQQVFVKKSARYYLRAIELYPKHAGAYENLGILCVDVDQPANAITNFKKAIALGRNVARVYYHLGVAYELNGDIPSAKEAYSTALIEQANYLPAQNRLNELLQ